MKNLQAGGMMEIFITLITLCFLALVAFVVWTFQYGQRRHEERRQLQAKAKDEYTEALDHLLKSPSDPSVRIKCLESGRVFYTFDIPDTQTFNGNGVVVGIQDNSANREARIQSDIEARVGHLRVVA